MSKFLSFIREYIDLKMGLAGAVVMAILVYYINYIGTHDTLGSSTAAIKQGFYTFLFGGVIMRSSEHLAVKISQKTLALVAACMIPSTVSLILTFGLHSLKGTPEPLQSTLVTAVFVIPSTAVWGYMKRKKTIEEY